MKKAVKFATQLDEAVLKNLKTFAKIQDKKISSVVSDAVAEYLQKYQIRPVFRESMTKVVEKNAKLLKKLAK